METEYPEEEVSAEEEGTNLKAIASLLGCLIILTFCVSHILIGGIYIDECPAEPIIPVYLIGE